MSLLLDARKKSQQAQSAQAGGSSNSGVELSLEPHPSSPETAAPASSAPDEHARIAGKNLFNAKSGSVSNTRAGANRNLMIALGATVVLLAAGAGYVWYAISGPKQQPLHPVNTAVVAVAKQAPAAVPAQNNLVSNIAPAEVAAPKPAGTTKPRNVTKRSARSAQARTRNQAPVHIELRREQPIDPILNNAYLAYRDGEFELAQQQYRDALKLDSNNTDALLGLGVIAQRRGESSEAAHYYAQVLALDPRNAVANSGMSALSNDDNRESRLKSLLNEQKNSSSLHFALGNFYAEQARWGDAQQSYFNAYKLAPGNAELAFNLAVSLDRLGQSKAATQYYQRALQLDPDNHAAFDHAKISKRISELTH